eukprot:IDg22119t1
MRHTNKAKCSSSINCQDRRRAQYQLTLIAIAILVNPHTARLAASHFHRKGRPTKERRRLSPTSVSSLFLSALRPHFGRSKEFVASLSLFAPGLFWFHAALPRCADPVYTSTLS